MTRKEVRALVDKFIKLVQEDPQGWEYRHKYTLRYPLINEYSGITETTWLEATHLKTWDAIWGPVPPQISYLGTEVNIPYFSLMKFQLFFAFRKIWTQRHKEAIEKDKAKERANLEKLNTLWTRTENS